MGLEDLNALTRILEDAARAVEHDVARAARVRTAGSVSTSSGLERYASLKEEAAHTGLPFLGPTDPVAAIDRLAAIQDSVGHYRERADFREYVEKLRELHGTR